MRITPEMVEDNIVSEHYFTGDAAIESPFDTKNIYRTSAIGEKEVLPSLMSLTICVLVLQDGFTVTGESAPINPNNFDPEIGRQVARRRAVDKIWPLMGYAALRERKVQQDKNLVRRETPAAGGDE